MLPLKILYGQVEIISNLSLYYSLVYFCKKAKSQNISLLIINPYIAANVDCGTLSHLLDSKTCYKILFSLLVKQVARILTESLGVLFQKNKNGNVQLISYYYIKHKRNMHHSKIKMIACFIIDMNGSLVYFVYRN